MLAATAPEGVVYSIHRNPTNAWVFRPAGTHFVVLSAGLHEWFLGSATAGNHADCGATSGVKSFDFATGELHDGGVAIVRDEGGTHAGGPREFPAVAGAGFHVTHRDALGDFRQGECVPFGDFGGDPDLEFIPGPDTFGGENIPAIAVVEFDEGNGGRPCGVVFNVNDFARHRVGVFD